MAPNSRQNKIISTWILIFQLKPIGLPKIKSLLNLFSTFKHTIMARKIIAFLFLLLPFIGSSQMRSSFDLVMGIEHSYRKLTGGSVEFMQTRDDKETGKSNWRFGFNYNRRLTEKLFLKTGARLASVGFNGEKRMLKWPSEIDSNGAWTPDPTLIHEYQEINDYWFFEIPIIGRYEFGGKKLIPFV